MSVIFKFSIIGKCLLCLILITLKFDNSMAFSVLDCPTIMIDNAVTGTDVCYGLAGTVTINNSQIGVVYNAYMNGSNTIVGTGNGNGGNLSISVNASMLTPGIHNISIQAVSCNIATLTNTAEINVIGLPSAVYGPASVCTNANTGLAYSTIGIAPINNSLTYNWSTTGATIASGTGTNNISVDLNTVGANGVITLVSVSTATVTCPINRSITVSQVLDYSTEDMTISEDTICAGNSVTFTVINANAVGYNWVTGSGVEDQTSATYYPKVFRFNTPGNISITLQPVHPCRTSITPITKSIYVISPPIADAGSDVYLSTIQPTILDGSASSQGPTYKYQWTTSDPSTLITTPNAMTTEITPSEFQSIYTLTVSTINAASCLASDEVEVNVGTTETDQTIGQNNEITLYPLPATNSLMIKGIDGDVSVDILDYLGGKVMHSENKHLNISDLSSGSYLILIHSNDKVYSKVFIKE